jgi:tetratricopeptide (TPR) repeat protein
MLDVEIYGMNAGLHHLTNLWFHIANTLLLFGLLFRTTGGLGRSAMVAALFAAHPIHVESVAWIAERKDVLSTLFWLLTMHAYVQYVRKPRFGRYLVVVVAFALGLMSKPMLVTLPIVLLLFDVWPLQRVRFENGQLEVWMRMIREKIPLFILALASSIVTVIVQAQGGAVRNFEMFPLYRRVANAVVSYVAYLGQMLWPGNLSAYYPYPSLPLWSIIVSAVVLVAASFMVIRLSKSRSFLFAGWFWYLITLIPVIGLVQVGGQARADRYTYIPLIGIFIVVVWGIHLVLRGWRYGDIALKAMACILVCALAAGARHQVRYWESDLSLWERAATVTADNYFAHTNLGYALLERGDVAEGIANYKEALRINPDSAETYNGLGLALARQGQLDAAIEQYRLAIRTRPGFSDAHSNLGIALASRGDMQEAFSEFQRALEISPENPEILYNYGFTLANLGRLDEAISYYRKAVAIRPGYADAYFQTGNIFAGKGMLEEAAAEYAKALEIRPDYEDAHNNLGFVLMSQGRYGDAITHFREALRINPNSDRARRNLNRALAEVGS